MKTLRDSFAGSGSRNSDPARCKRILCWIRRGCLALVVAAYATGAVRLIAAPPIEPTDVADRANTSFRLTGTVVDADTGDTLPARVHLRNDRGEWYFVQSDATAGTAVEYRRSPARVPGSVEMHTTVSPHPFHVDLPPGNYQLQRRTGQGVRAARTRPANCRCADRIRFAAAGAGSIWQIVVGIQATRMFIVLSTNYRT